MVRHVRAPQGPGAALKLCLALAFALLRAPFELEALFMDEAAPGTQNEGRSFEAFVFNGRDASGSRYPYLASLRHPGTGDHFCGGALIAPSIVLTAAHCVDGARSGHKTPLIHFGRTCTNCRSETGFQVAQTVHQIIHSNWTGDISAGSDLAILILGSAMDGPFLRVLPQTDPAKERFDFEYLTFAGYGVVEGTRISSRLQDVELPFREKRLCDILYQVSGYGVTPPDDAICAGGFDVEVCQGDSGGPLIVPGSGPEEDHAIGVLSGGTPGCGVEVHIPAVFTGLFRYKRDLENFVPLQFQGAAGPSPTPSPTASPTRAPTPAPTAPLDLPGTSSTDMEALLFFKLNRMKSGQWSDPSDWLFFRDMCSQWNHMACSGDSRVSQLFLGNTGLSGSVPEVFSALDGIQKMYLFSNDLTGTLPASWSRLTNLQILSLFSNSATGTLPKEWSTLRNLKSLILRSNGLVGSIPEQWSVINPRITLLDQNSIQGRVPQGWTGLVNL